MIDKHPQLGGRLGEKKNSEEKIQIARTFKEAGADLLTISKAIGMPVEEIERLYVFRLHPKKHSIVGRIVSWHIQQVLWSMKTTER